MIDEKASDTPVTEVVVEGVSLTSRYGKQHEFRNMTEAVLALPWEARAAMESLWCDSKATQCYIASLRPEWRCYAVAAAVGEALSNVLYEKHGGHNGVFVEYGGSETYESEESGFLW